MLKQSSRLMSVKFTKFSTESSFENWAPNSDRQISQVFLWSVSSGAARFPQPVCLSRVTLRYFDRFQMILATLTWWPLKVCGPAFCISRGCHFLENALRKPGFDVTDLTHSKWSVKSRCGEMLMCVWWQVITQAPGRENKLYGWYYSKVYKLEIRWQSQKLKTHDSYQCGPHTAFVFCLIHVFLLVLSVFPNLSSVPLVA